MGQTVQFGYGKANLSNTLATYAVMKVEEPFARVSGVNSGKRHGMGATYPVGRHDMHGVLINANVEHDNGTVILLQVGWKRGGAPIRDGALFLRLRAGAPLYRVNAFVPTGYENTHGDRFVVFSGHADIMNEDELTVLGIKVPRNYIQRSMQTEELEECFEIEEVAPETQGRPTLTAIASPTGMVMREIAPTPRRRMIFRRNGS